MATLTEQNYVDQFVIAEWDQAYSRVEGTFNNDTGAEASFAKGLVVELSGTDYVPLATEANAIGILATTITDLANGGDIQASFVVRGLVVVDNDALDYNGVADPDAARTALLGLSPPIVASDEAASTSSQIGTGT